MIDIKNWTSEFTKKAGNIFGERTYFIGIQGSYARNEANEKSDIDIVLILDKIDMGDLEKYRGLLDTLPNRELSCGFVSGKDELLNWEPSDLFQFYHDTTPIVGTLDFLLSKIDKQDVKRAIKIGKCNIYHVCVHNFIHEQSDEILRSLYKSATFVIQAIYFYNNGKYVRSKNELLPLLNGTEKEILETAVKLKNGANTNFEEMTEKFPYLVAEHEGKIIGYAYLDHYSERSAYRFTSDVSIYVDKDFHSLGAGRSLIEALEGEARKIGIKNLISIITEENKNSMNFHRKNGYYEKGHLEKVGFKFGKWLDVVIMQKKI